MPVTSDYDTGLHPLSRLINLHFDFRKHSVFCDEVFVKQEIVGKQKQ